MKVKHYNIQLCTFLAFFLTGLMLIATGFFMFHFLTTIRLTTREVFTGVSPINVFADIYVCIFRLGFIVWACYPIGLVYRIIKRGVR